MNDPYKVVGRWEIAEDRKSGIIKLQSLEIAECPPGTLPWLSPHGYEITDDGWVLNPYQK